MTRRETTLFVAFIILAITASMSLYLIVRVSSLRQMEAQIDQLEVSVSGLKNATRSALQNREKIAELKADLESAKRIAYPTSEIDKYIFTDRVN